MSGELWALNKALKAHDRDLYARTCKDGVVRVFQRLRTGFALNGQEWLVCSLTNTWASSGEPRGWGIEPVLDHIKQGSLAQRDRMNEELKKSQEAARESSARTAANSAENAAAEMHSGFKKDFAYTLTHSMDMKNDPRRKTDKRRI